jgi:hypothetical protein
MTKQDLLTALNTAIQHLEAIVIKDKIHKAYQVGIGIEHAEILQVVEDLNRLAKDVRKKSK